MKKDCTNFKLGKIKKGNLVNFDKQMFWNFDNTLAIFLRDGLTAYKEMSRRIPLSIYGKYRLDKTLSQQEKDSKALVEWHKILNDMIAGFAAYISLEEGSEDERDNKYKAFKKALRLLSKWWSALWIFEIK